MQLPLHCSKPISVLLVDDDALIRMGIRHFISNEEFSVVGEAENGSEAVEAVAALQPDVVVMDIGLPIMNGFDSSRLIKERSSSTKIIMLSSHNSHDAVQEALTSGASGYCLKDIESKRLQEAIKTVSRGDIWLDAGIAQNMVSLCHRKAIPAPSMPSQLDVLSDLERQTLRLLLQGCTTGGIAETFNMSYQNAKSNIESILNKLGCTEFESERTATFFELERITAPTQQLQPEKPNELTDKYEIIELIGRGGMSLVYKARHKLLNRDVAVKFICRDTGSDSIAERFSREARITSHLSHPNIIRILDYGLTNSHQPYMVMNLEEGPTLLDVLRRRSQLPEPEAVEIFRQLASALSYSHAQGIIHRDIKPANVILTHGESGKVQPKLLDFGLAKLATPENTAQDLTQPGRILGSPLYMSPEQIRGEQVDHRCDIYSFGCLMYEVLCGRPPHVGLSAIETMTMHLQDEPAAPNPYSCSPKLQQIIYQCLRKDKEDRIQSMNEVLSLLGNSC